MIRYAKHTATKVPEHCRAFHVLLCHSYVTIGTDSSTGVVQMSTHSRNVQWAVQDAMLVKQIYISKYIYITPQGEGTAVHSLEQGLSLT